MTPHHRNRSRLAGLASAALLLLSGGLTAASAQVAVQPAEAPSPGVWRGAIEGSRDVIRQQMQEVGVPGLSVAVAVDGEVVWAEGFGFADLENHVAVVPDTKFRIASISKALTSAGLGILVQEGRVDLDAPVQQYVPSFPEKRWPVTTREVAGHIAGIRHYRGLEFRSAVHYDDVVDALEIFENDTLLFEPGTQYSYSTYGWNLISAVMQGAAGIPFLRFMRQRVLDPLGMRETVGEFVDSIIPYRARFYIRGEDGRVVNAPFVDNSNKWAGGGYLSTARDMVRYGSSYLDHAILEPATVDLLWTSQHLRDGEATDYGMGWFVRDEDGVRTVWHTGGAVGGSTILMIFPDRGIVVSILTNIQSGRPTQAARSVADLFWDTKQGSLP